MDMTLGKLLTGNSTLDAAIRTAYQRGQDHPEDKVEIKRSVQLEVTYDTIRAICSTKIRNWSQTDAFQMLETPKKERAMYLKCRTRQDVSEAQKRAVMDSFLKDLYQGDPAKDRKIMDAFRLGRKDSPSRLPDETVEIQRRAARIDTRVRHLVVLVRDQGCSIDQALDVPRIPQNERKTYQKILASRIPNSK